MNYVIEIGEDVVFQNNPVIYRTISTKAEASKEIMGDHYFCVGYYQDLKDVIKTRQFNSRRTGKFHQFLNAFETIFKLTPNSVLFGDWINAGMVQTFMLPLNEFDTIC